VIDPIASPPTIGAPSGTGTAGIAPLRPAMPTAPAETAGADFAAMLGSLFTNTAGAVRQAETISVAGIKGQASVQQVVEAVMTAEQSLQGALAVRDKVVGAYLEISRMQI
jgi:flagellar hook-basal body complex protein FliE